MYRDAAYVDELDPNDDVSCISLYVVVKGISSNRPYSKVVNFCIMQLAYVCVL